MKKLCLAVMALCCIFLTGCDLNIENAADSVDSAIRGIGKPSQGLSNDLNGVVDKFEEAFGRSDAL